MENPRPRPTPPRGTTRATGERPADRRECPGCATLIDRGQIACAPCWRLVPGTLKAKLGGTTPGTIGRARVVAEMRLWLKDNPR